MRTDEFCRADYVIPSLKEIDLGFAGREKPNHAIHRRITALKVGDPLRLIHETRGYTLLTPDGQRIGQLARGFTPPPGECLSASVHALVTWRKRDTRAEYLNSCQCETWEVVVPELVFGEGEMGDFGR